MQTPHHPRYTLQPVPSRPVQALLFSQVLVLAGIFGAAVAAFPWLTVLVPLVAAGVVVIDVRCRNAARLLGITLCFACGLGWAWFWQPALPPAGDPVRGEISGQVLEVASLYDRRLRVTLDDVRVAAHSERETTAPKAFSGRVTWTLEGFAGVTRPMPGQTVLFSGKVMPITGFRNDDADGGELWWARQGIFWRVWSGQDTEVRVAGKPFWAAELRETLRKNLMARLQALYPDTQKRTLYGVPGESAPQGSGFVPALLFGDRFYMGVDDWNRLSYAGLLHSIALSGQHLAVAGLLAGLLLWLTGRMRPAVFLFRPRFTLALWLALPLAALYLWLGNAPDSLLRAAIMLGCLAVAVTVRRAATLLDGLVWALGLMVLVDPGIVAEVGAQLSFLAVFGIMLAAPLLQRWRMVAVHKPRLFAGGSRWLFAGGALVLCSGIIQISTLPVTLQNFGWISPWWLLNVVWLPVLGVWVLPLCVLALVAEVLHMGPVADVALVLAVEPCGLLLEGLRLLDAHLAPLWCLRPHWAASTGLLVLLTGTALLWERARVPVASRFLCVLGLALLLSGPFVRLAQGLQSEAKLRLLDVGQGQAALLEFPGERRFLLDGGGVRSARFDTGQHILAPVLTRNRPPRVNALILSHPDMDHLRGLLFVAKNFAVGETVLPVGVNGHDTARNLFVDFLRILRENAIPVQEAQAGAELALYDAAKQAWVLEVLAPLDGRPLASNDGLVLRVVRETEGLVILPGDATRSLLAALAREGRSLQTEILVAPHHGSRHNLREDFLRAANPKEIWVSCAAFNRYGFPAKELRDFCAEQGIRLRETAIEGEIVVSWKL